MITVIFGIIKFKECEVSLTQLQVKIILFAAIILFKPYIFMVPRLFYNSFLLLYIATILLLRLPIFYSQTSVAK